MKKILIIDDMVAVRRSLSVALSADGYEVQEAENGTIAKKFLDNNLDVDLVISDLLMPNGDGLEVLKTLMCTQSSAKFIIMTGGGHEALHGKPMEIIQKHADKVLAKPFERQTLLDAVREVLS